jgi:hypothetical protein
MRTRTIGRWVSALVVGTMIVMAAFAAISGDVSLATDFVWG